jgi:hypothetical protein
LVEPNITCGPKVSPLVVLRRVAAARRRCRCWWSACSRPARPQSGSRKIVSVQMSCTFEPLATITGRSEFVVLSAF